METKKGVAIAFIALIAIAFVSFIVIQLGRLEPQSAEDELITYLDRNNVEYSSRADMINLADTVCELDAQGADTDSFLLIEFSQEDVSYIQFGVLNGNYCEGK